VGFIYRGRSKVASTMFADALIILYSKLTARNACSVCDKTKKEKEIDRSREWKEARNTVWHYAMSCEETTKSSAVGYVSANYCSSLGIHSGSD